MQQFGQRALQFVPPRSESPVQEVSDSELVERYRDSRDQKSFGELVKRYDRELFRYLYRKLGGYAKADDVSQEVWLKVALNLDKFDCNLRFSPWLFTVASRVIVDFLRRESRHKAHSLHTTDRATLDDVLMSGRQSRGIVQEEESVRDRMIRAEEQERLRRAIPNLPDHTRGLIELLVFEGKSREEARAILKIPKGTIRSRYWSALGQLRGVLWEEN